MEEQQIDQTDTLPRIGSDQGDQTGEALVPLGEVGLEAHQPRKRLGGFILRKGNTDSGCK
jgi:hypothetical protein